MNFFKLLDLCIEWSVKLASFAIDAFIPDELTAGVAPHIFATRSGIRLQVAEKDVERAKAAMLSEVDPFTDDFSTEGE